VQRAGLLRARPPRQRPHREVVRYSPTDW
jgi:hypothetical protein